MSCTGVENGRHSPSHSSAVVDDEEVVDDEKAEYYMPDTLTGNGNSMSESIVLAPASIHAYLEKSLKPAGKIHIDLGSKVVSISGIFAQDARRADEPQNLSINGEMQERIETDSDLKELVRKVDAAAGTDRLELATEITSQRPAIVLRNVITQEFLKRFKYEPIFDANSVMDSSVNLTANRDSCMSNTHLTGMIRLVMPRNDGDGLEPLALDHPILYDATAEFDANTQTIEYRIDFHVEAAKPPPKKKFCVIL